MFDSGYGYDGLSDLILSLVAPVIIVLIIVAVVPVFNARRRKNPGMILEEFNFNENEDEFLKIKGRVPGFWNWVLSLFDKAPTTYFTCNKQVLKYEALKIKYNIPLANITCVSSGMLKSSVLLLVLGIILCISIFGIPIGIILLIVWALNRKTMHFGIYIGENKPMITLTMKRGIIDSIDINKFESAAHVLNKAVLENTKAK
jgi:hypothetical protein